MPISECRLGDAGKNGAFLSALLLFLAPPSFAVETTHDVLVIVGAAGDAEYGAGFSEAANAWQNACTAAGARCTIIGDTEASTSVEAGSAAEPADKDLFKAWLEAATSASATPLWIAYIGHGTFDGREARLNLRGTDVTATELQAWLAPLRRPLVFVHGGAASGPFLPLLSGPGRIVITATESGEEINFARFGERFAAAVADPAADLDGDGQTTVLEAYLSAARRVQDFYAEELRMATEHPLLDDNGDKRGTPPDWFRGTRATKRAEGGAAPDGVYAHRIALVQSAAERALTPAQRAARDRLEEELERLRERKSSMAERDYLRELEILLRQISAIYRPPTVEPTPSTDGADVPGT